MFDRFGELRTRSHTVELRDVLFGFLATSVLLDRG